MTTQKRQARLITADELSVETEIEYSDAEFNSVYIEAPSFYTRATRDGYRVYGLAIMENYYPVGAVQPQRRPVYKETGNIL